MVNGVHVAPLVYWLGLDNNNNNLNHEYISSNNNQSHSDVESLQKKSFASMLYDSGTPKRQE